MISMREAYEKIGANYDDACARLMGGKCLPALPSSFWMTRHGQIAGGRHGGGRRRRCVYGSAHSRA